MAKIHNLLGMSMERAYDKTQCSDDIKPGDFLLVEDGIAMMDGAYPVMISGMSGVFHEYHTNTQEGRALRDAALARYEALEAAGDAADATVAVDLSEVPAVNAARLEAIAQADAHLNNVALPTYTEVAYALAELAELFAESTQFTELGNARALVARLQAVKV